MAAVSYFLSELVPSTGLYADYPLADVSAPNEPDVVTDYSGNGRDLDPIHTTTAEYVLDQLNGHPALQFTGLLPVKYAPSVAFKHVFILTKYDLAANFGGTYRGLLTGDTSGDILVGDNAASSTKFTNFAFGGTYSYIKSQVSYAESNQQAPFTNFELIEVSLSTGFAPDAIQLGQQKADTGRRWRGPVADMKLYSAVLTGADLAKLRLYYDLKYGLWLLNGTTLNFPSPDITGIRWNHFKQVPTQWDRVTDTWEYEDAGQDQNDRTDTPPTEWDIVFTGLSYAQLQIFEAFNTMARRSRSFSFIDKFAVTWTGVKIKNYDSSHSEHRSWDNTCSFTLCKFS